MLEWASRQEHVGPESVTVREVRRGAASPLSLAYRVTRPTSDRYGLDGESPLEDEAGREIRVFEGLALLLSARRVSSLGLTLANFDAITSLIAPVFRRLWLAETRIDPVLSTAISVGGKRPGSFRLATHVTEPYQVPAD